MNGRNQFLRMYALQLVGSTRPHKYISRIYLHIPTSNRDKLKWVQAAPLS